MQHFLRFLRLVRIVNYTVRTLGERGAWWCGQNLCSIVRAFLASPPTIKMTVGAYK